MANSVVGSSHLKSVDVLDDLAYLLVRNTELSFTWSNVHFSRLETLDAHSQKQIVKINNYGLKLRIREDFIINQVFGYISNLNLNV